MNGFLSAIQQSKPLLITCLTLAIGFGVVAQMACHEVAEWWRDRRYARQEEDAQFEAERIRHGWDEEDSDEWTLTNETYHAQGLRTVNERWRDRIDRTVEAIRPYSPQWVAPRGYATQVALTQTVQWPTWTEEERALEGRHRLVDNPIPWEARPVSPAPAYYTRQQMRALIADTGQYQLVPDTGQHQLVGV